MSKYRLRVIDFIRFCEYNEDVFLYSVCSWEMVKAGGTLMTYLSIAQTADRWGISPRRIQILCREGRVTGAVRIGHAWAIPDDEPKPADTRTKSGKYMKEKSNITEELQ